MRPINLLKIFPIFLFLLKILINLPFLICTVILMHIIPNIPIINKFSRLQLIIFLFNTFYKVKLFLCMYESLT